MMLPRLYSAETTDFSDNGLGVLADAIECKVTQGFGSSLLEMKYPTSGRLFGELQSMRIIYAQPEPNANPQPFSIYKMKKLSSGIAVVYARHVCYNLDGFVIVPFGQKTLTNLFSTIEDYVVTGENADMTEPEKNRHKFNFNFEIDSDVIKYFSIEKPTDVWSMIGKNSGSILEKFNKEVVFDHYTVKFVTKRGKDDGASIKYGVNLLSLEQEENF
jgi:phage minor structural protein